MKEVGVSGRAECLFIHSIIHSFTVSFPQTYRMIALLSLVYADEWSSVDANVDECGLLCGRSDGNKGEERRK